MRLKIACCKYYIEHRINMIGIMSGLVLCSLGLILDSPVLLIAAPCVWLTYLLAYVFYLWMTRR